MEIRHGEGGNDSKLFVDDLFSAYLKYARNLNFRAELIHSSDGHMMAKIKGKGVGIAFQHESGKHCVQRVPPTESKGRKQTSIISVAILPIPKKIEISISDRDLKIEGVNLSSPGGQHANRTISGCRITHIPTGVQACVNGRSYHVNEREARSIIYAKIFDMEKIKENDKYSSDRKKQMGGGGRSAKVRTYNFMNSRVVDHRLGTETGNIKAIMKGHFELIFKN